MSLILSMAAESAAFSCRPLSETVYFRCVGDDCEFAFATTQRPGMGFCDRYWRFEDLQFERARRLERIMGLVRTPKVSGLLSLSLTKPSANYVYDSWTEAGLIRSGLVDHLDRDPASLSKSDRQRLLDNLAAGGVTSALVDVDASDEALGELRGRLSEQFHRQHTDMLKQFVVRNLPAAPLLIWLLYSAVLVGYGLSQRLLELASRWRGPSSTPIQSGRRSSWGGLTKQICAQLAVVAIALPAIASHGPEWLALTGTLAARLLTLELSLLAPIGLVHGLVAVLRSRGPEPTSIR